LFYSHAFLGRYRIGFAVLVLLAFIWLHEAGVETTRFAPLQLMDERFAFERHHFPGEAFWTTIGLAALLTALGFGLGLVRDATVATLLAEKMSSREKVFTTFLGLAGLFLAMYLSEHFKTATPVKLPGASEGFEGVVQVYATAAVDAPKAEETAILAKTARDTAKQLSEMAEFLRCSSLPPVFIVHRRDLGANEFQDGALKWDQGLMVRTNLTATDFDPERLQVWIERQMLVTRTRGLANRERNAWVLDGFLVWWSNREGTENRSRHWAAILAASAEAMPRDFSREHLKRWYSFRHQAGEIKARCLAGVGFDTLVRQHGEEACRKFSGEFFARDYPEDVRGWLRDISNPAGRRLRRAANISLDDFVKEWRKAVPPKEAKP
jgi:hypothetical protein